MAGYGEGGGMGEMIAMVVANEGTQALTLFDAIAQDGALRPKEFAVVMQRELVTLLKKAVDMLFTAGPAAVPPFDSLKPAAERAVERVDSSHLRGLLEMLFRVMDGNGNGAIERAEFEGFFKSFFGPEAGPDGILNTVFKMVDKNGNGTVSVDEAQAVITAIMEILSTLIGAVADIGESILTSAEVATLLKDMIVASPFFKKLDENSDGVVSREEFVKFLHAEDCLLNQIDMNAQVQQVRPLRDMFASFESSSQAQIWMKMKELTVGGIDEVTFVGNVVKLFNEYVESQSIDEQCKSFDQILNLQDQLAATLPPAQRAGIEMQKKAFEALTKTEQFKPALQRAQKRATEYFPEIARALFQFLDVDGTGKVTAKELSMLKAVLDAVLHLGDRPVEDPSNPNANLQGPPVENARTLFLAVFDVLDRNGDGSLQPDEIVGWVVKLGCMLCANFRIMAHQGIECFMDEISKMLLAEGWKTAGLKELKPDELVGFVMSAPMMIAGLVMQMQTDVAKAKESAS